MISRPLKFNSASFQIVIWQLLAGLLVHLLRERPERTQKILAFRTVVLVGAD